MSGDLEAPRRALETLKRVLAKRPHKDDHALADATFDLCAWRDGLIERGGSGEAERARLERVNGVLSVVAGMHYPLGKIPWEALEAAVKALEQLVEAAAA